jgi:hypothetical protein
VIEGYAEFGELTFQLLIFGVEVGVATCWIFLQKLGEFVCGWVRGDVLLHGLSPFKGGRPYGRPVEVLILFLVGGLADEASIERYAIELHGEATILVGPCDSHTGPITFPVSAFTDVPGDVTGGFAGRLGFSFGVI